MKSSKLSPRFLCALTVFSLMGQIAWVVENMYFNVFIYKMFHASPPIFRPWSRQAPLRPR